MAEFAYNNGHQEGIKNTPFFANYGINPEYHAIGHLMNAEIRPLEEISQLHKVLQAEMTQAQLRHKGYYDARSKPDPNLQSLGQSVRDSRHVADCAIGVWAILVYYRPRFSTVQPRSRASNQEL